MVKWRSGTTGQAFTSRPDWAIEVPEPRGPISFGVFAHEVAHQLYHRGNSKPRWAEELEAEEYALKQFERFRLKGKEEYEVTAVKHVAYAFNKALRRGADPRQIQRAVPKWWEAAKPYVRNQEETMAATETQNEFRDRLLAAVGAVPGVELFEKSGGYVTVKHGKTTLGYVTGKRKVRVDLPMRGGTRANLLVSSDEELAKAVAEMETFIPPLEREANPDPKPASKRKKAAAKAESKPAAEATDAS